LSDELVKALKHYAVDNDSTMGETIERVCREFLVKKGYLKTLREA